MDAKEPSTIRTSWRTHRATFAAVVAVASGAGCLTHPLGTPSTSGYGSGGAAGVTGFDDCAPSQSPASLRSLPRPSGTIRQDLLQSLGLPGSSTLRDAAARIDRALDRRGYETRAWYIVQGGFAAVTSVERFDPEGRPDLVPQRFLQLQGAQPFPVYTRTEEPNHNGERYRQFVFAVTPHGPPSNPSQPDIVDAVSASQGGMRCLPGDLLGQAASSYTLHVLVYEFRIQDTANPEIVWVPPERALPAETHLSGSGIPPALRTPD